MTKSSDPLSLTSLTDTVTVDTSSNLKFTNVYTASNRTFAMTTPAGRTRSLVLDALGRMSSRQRDGLFAESFAYDTSGRLSTATQSTRVRRYGYDATSGLLASVTDPMSHVVAYVRDGAGRVTQQTLADGGKVSFTYDGAGRLASMTTPAGHTHHVTHDLVGNLAGYVAPNADAAPTVTQWLYDIDGNLVTYARPDGAAVTFGYDGADRMTGATFPGGAIAFSYDALTGRVLTASGPGDDLVSYSYDGLLTTQIAWAGTVGGRVAWTYDKSMKVVNELVDGTSGASYAYDNDGLVTKAGAMVITNNPAGQFSGSTLRNATDTVTYDNFGRRATYTAKYGATTLFATTITPDPLGRVATKSETV